MNALRNFPIDVLLLIVARVTLVALIGRLLMAALSRASASTRYLIAVTTFCSMLAIPLISAAGLQWRLALLPPNPKSAPAITTAETIELQSDAGVNVTAHPIVSAAPAAEDSLPGRIRAAWRGWLLVAILAVAAALVARMLIGIAAISWIGEAGEGLTSGCRWSVIGCRLSVSSGPTTDNRQLTTRIPQPATSAKLLPVQ